MTEKSEPSLGTPQSRPKDDPARGAPQPTARAKGPPQDPEAFRRWIGIERLKVDMRRLELETRRLEEPAPARRSALPLLGTLLIAATLVLTGLLGSSLLSQREEIGMLRAEQAALAERLSQSQADLTDLAEQIAQEKATQVARNAVPAPLAAASAATPASVSSTPNASDTGAQTPPAPALPGDGYTVRIFAPIEGMAQAKINQFSSGLEAQGFDVVVSDTGVVQTTSNTLSYHASAEDMAKRVAGILKARRPPVDVELRVSPSIPDNARQVLILNLTEEAFR